MKKFCFVIPTYNNKLLLKNTLEALNHQKGFGPEDYEVAVVDDGSVDCTYEYIRDINKNYALKYIYLQRDEVSCRGRARNMGRQLADAKYIIFIDSDILVREDYLFELERCFSMEEDLAVIGTRLYLSQEIPYDTVLDKSVFRKYSFDKVDCVQYEIRHLMFNHMSYNSHCGIPPWLKFFSCNAVAPKKYLDRIGGFDEKYKGWGMEDNDLGYRLSLEGLNIVINSRMEVLHQFHGKVDPSGIPIDKKNEFHKNIDYFMKKFPEAFPISRAKVYDFFEGKVSNAFGLDSDSAEKILINFNDIAKLENIKSKILQLCMRDKLEIVVEDEVEATDLDIWIQLLKNPRSIPKYYPVSKRLKESFDPFRG
jgi:GT2 family glycosyltransferase